MQIPFDPAALDNGGYFVCPRVFPRLESSPSGKRELIVLADDNADMRQYLTRLLSEQYEVHAAADGLQALEATRKLRPALVLADVMMPLLDGFGLLRAIRDDSALAGTLVVLLSARAGEESRVEGLEADADDYLIKPFAARELLARVAAHVKLASLRRETAQREERMRSEAELDARNCTPAKNGWPRRTAFTVNCSRPMQNCNYKLRCCSSFLCPPGRSSRMGRPIRESGLA